MLQTDDRLESHNVISINRLRFHRRCDLKPSLVVRGTGDAGSAVALALFGSEPSVPNK
jgi:hypothetical protein